MMRLLENAHKLRASSQPRHPSGGGIVTGGGRISVGGVVGVGGATVGALGLGAPAAGADTGDVAAWGRAPPLPVPAEPMAAEAAYRALLSRVPECITASSVAEAFALMPALPGESPRRASSFLGSTGVGMSSTRRTPSQVREQLGPRAEIGRAPPAGDAPHAAAQHAPQPQRVYPKPAPHAAPGIGEALTSRWWRASEWWGGAGTPLPDFAFDFNLMITESRVPEKVAHDLLCGWAEEVDSRASRMLVALCSTLSGLCASGAPPAAEEKRTPPSYRRCVEQLRRGVHTLHSTSINIRIGAGVAELARTIEYTLVSLLALGDAPPTTTTAASPTAEAAAAIAADPPTLDAALVDGLLARELGLLIKVLVERVMVVIQWLGAMTPTFESLGFQFDQMIATRKAAAVLRERYTTPVVSGGGLGGGGLGGVGLGGAGLGGAGLGAPPALRAAVEYGGAGPVSWF